MAITIEMNQKIQNLQIIDKYMYVCMYVCVCVCVGVCGCVCDYINSNVKTSKMPKKIYN